MSPLLPAPAGGLRVGVRVPLTLRDAAGQVLLPRGQAVTDEAQLQALLAQPLFVAQDESDAFRRAHAERLRQQAAAGLPEPDWPGWRARARALLVEPSAEGWLPALTALRDELLAQARARPDATLRRLVHDAGLDWRDYSASHALFVTVLCDLASARLSFWQPAWTGPLTLASLSMNLSITALQDELARQEGPLTEQQRALVQGHAERSAWMLGQLGVSDPLWVETVRHHHDAPPGPLRTRAPAGVLARLLHRADAYAARMSPRRSRAASPAAKGAQTAFVDETGQPDEAGQALVKVTGVYPPGSWVRLASGELALVMRRTEDMKAPAVVAITDAQEERLPVPLARDTHEPAWAIVESVSPADIHDRPDLAVIDSLDTLAALPRAGG